MDRMRSGAPEAWGATLALAALLLGCGGGVAARADGEKGEAGAKGADGGGAARPEGAKGGDGGGAGPAGGRGAAGPTGTAAPAQGGASPGGKTPRPVEPRPRIRPARELLDELARERLYTPDDVRDERPKAELIALFAPTATSRFTPAAAPPADLVETAVRGGGALPYRLFQVRTHFWWDEVGAYAARAVALSRAARLESIDAHEVPPPSNEYTVAKKRALRFRADLGVSTAAFDPLSLARPDDALDPGEMFATSEQEALDKLKRWMAEPDVLTPAFLAAIAALPPQVVVERLLVSRRKLELWLAGIYEHEAAATAARLAPEISSEYGEPRLSRRADTFIISCERNR
jgi:hypothetical protein